MNRRLADRLVILVVAVLLTLGLFGTWLTYRRTWAADGMMGSMMDGSTGGMAHTSPLWYGLATVVLVAVIGGVYTVIREDFTDPQSDRGSSSSSPVEPDGTDPMRAAAGSTEAAPTGRRVLDLLPDDERRVLEPVLTSPGLTQIELRDRSDFSKSKVSQTVSELEKRGLLYRERQGRTYRVYPDAEIAEVAAE